MLLCINMARSPLGCFFIKIKACGLLPSPFPPIVDWQCFHFQWSLSYGFPCLLTGLNWITWYFVYWETKIFFFSELIQEKVNKMLTHVFLCLIILFTWNVQFLSYFTVLCILSPSLLTPFFYRLSLNLNFFVSNPV